VARECNISHGFKSDLTYHRSLGGATATAPASGFNNSDLAVYFTQRASVASRTPTRPIPSPTNTIKVTQTPSPSPKLPTGAIAGISVGGALILIALVLGGCYIAHHRRRKRQAPVPPVPTNDVIESPPVPLNPYSPGRYYQQEPQYQLPANPPPAELSVNNYQMHQVYPKESVIQQIHESQYPAYNTGWQHSPPPQHSPTMSPHLSSSTARSQLRN
jgi:hypothetical protein